MTPMTEITPVSKDDAKRISAEMKEVADDVTEQVAKSMEALKISIDRYIELSKSKK